MTMKPTTNCFVSLVFLELVVLLATIKVGSCHASSYMGCTARERQTLLRFKQDLDDPSNRLASWTAGGDCCKWVGVVCHNMTGHVLQLHLSNPISFDNKTTTLGEMDAYERSKLKGKINPSLLHLEHLIHLDLSGNDFRGKFDSLAFLGSMRNLKYLNLSDTGLVGMIPHQLGNLSSLQYLDLSNYKMYDSALSYVDNLGWLSDLRSLKHLDLGGVNLSKTFDQWLFTNDLPSLAVLKLSHCQLHLLPPLFNANFSSLTSLDLSSNSFDSPIIPDGIQNLTSLVYLDLSDNSFNFSIPASLCRLSHLEHLFLNDNHLQGSFSGLIGNLTSNIVELDLGYNRELGGKISATFGRLCNLKLISFKNVNLSQGMSEVLDIFSGCVSNHLEYLDLSSTQLFGHLTNQLGQLKNLKYLMIANNSISGVIPPCLGQLSLLRGLALLHNKLNGTLNEIHFSNLTRLIWFGASGNSLIVEVNKNWTPPFHQLEVLDLGSCSVGPRFPTWILSLKVLYYLDLSYSNIADTIPTKFWKFLPRYNFFNLSNNQIYGHIPDLPDTGRLETLDLSSNNLSGPLPLLSSHVYEVHFSNNSLSGSISHFLCHKMHKSKRMQVLKLGNNLFFGEIPDCLMNWRALVVLNLSKNKLVGKLPTSIGALSVLQSLSLRGNRLSGTIPMSFQNCTGLVALDLGENAFVGNVPNWFGERLPNLKILNLRGNNFHGLLPVKICFLEDLQILDLAYNNLSGNIPKCIGNLTSMVTMDSSASNDIEYYSDTYIGGGRLVEDELLVMKGQVAEYSTILNLVKSIDLSKNNFSGEVPREITNLRALVSLNLSYNSFRGKIPRDIGDMRFLQHLDLSENKLSGEIPQTISGLSLLNHLNLSNNKLVGRIPTGTQLQSFEASSFAGNELCGPPLPKNCTQTIPPPDDASEEGKDGNEIEVDWFYVSMALGVVVGFSSLIGPLLVSRRWRHKYCYFLDRLGDKFKVL